MFIQTVKEEFDFNIFKTKKHKIFASFEYLGMHTNYMNEFKNSFNISIPDHQERREATLLK